MNPTSSKLFVGNLSFQTTRDELMHYFSGAGTVIDAVILTNKYTGRSRGFGFVQMSTPEEAINAKSMFHGKDFMGRVLVVNDATPERPKDIYEAPMHSADDQQVVAQESSTAAVDMPVVVKEAKSKSAAVSEPVAVEPVVESTVQPITEPVTEPVAPVADVVEPAVQPVADEVPVVEIPKTTV